MQEHFKKLRGAANALKAAANGLHVQLDLTEFNAALDELEDAFFSHISTPAKPPAPAKAAKAVVRVFDKTPE